MSDTRRLRDNQAFLRMLVECGDNPEQAKQLIRTANAEQIHSISEILHNILLKNVSLSLDEIKLLRRFRPLIYKLVDKRTHWTKKRRAIQQTGGWFPILAPILGAIAAGVGQSVIQKYV